MYRTAQGAREDGYEAFRDDYEQKQRLGALSSACVARRCVWARYGSHRHDHNHIQRGWLSRDDQTGYCRDRRTLDNDAGENRHADDGADDYRAYCNDRDQAANSRHDSRCGKSGNHPARHATDVRGGRCACSW
jgi:hypothetical protein